MKEHIKKHKEDGDGNNDNYMKEDDYDYSDAVILIKFKC